MEWRPRWRAIPYERVSWAFNEAAWWGAPRFRRVGVFQELRSPHFGGGTSFFYLPACLLPWNRPQRPLPAPPTAE
jgi:hypothetical protein